MDDDGEQGVDVDWVTGAIKSANATQVLSSDSNCVTIHILDRLLLLIEVLFFVAKNVWFGWQIYSNSQSAVRQQTHFEDLGKLKEFSLPEKLTHVGDKEQETNDIVLRKRSATFVANQTQKTPVAAIGGSKSSSKVGVEELQQVKQNDRKLFD